MDYKLSHHSKIKITISIDEELIKALDRFSPRNQKISRSRLIEEAIRKWQSDQIKQKIEKEIEEYYLSITEQEKEENKEWGKIAAKSASKLWD